MSQEFVIKSPGIESKINQLLPSQGGAGAGVDISASTMVVPIVDLTETAEGSSLRVDLQTAFSLTTISHNTVANTTTTLVNTTGYYRIFGSLSMFGAGNADFKMTDGTTTKFITRVFSNTGQNSNELFDFVVFLEAGDSLQAVSSSGSITIDVSTRQIADINGNLTNP
tara:strand:+ start:257 stop:760 length:504 start_codon:yes stop_codon:yes gene_type:complete